jgi:hypothetical protein
LPEKEREVRPPAWAKNSLGARRKHPFQRPKQYSQEKEAQPRPEEEERDCHDRGLVGGKGGSVRLASRGTLTFVAAGLAGDGGNARTFAGFGLLGM